MLRIMLLLFVITLSGCHTSLMYSGSAMTEKDLVVLYYPIDIGYDLIDGKPSEYYKHPVSNEIQLLPGHHTLVVSYGYVYTLPDRTITEVGNMPIEVEFVGEKGRAYKVDSNRGKVAPNISTGIIAPGTGVYWYPQVIETKRARRY